MSQGLLHSSQGNSHNAPPAEVAAIPCTDQPYVPSQPKAWQKDAAVKKVSEVSAVFGPGETLLTYRLISNGSPDLTWSDLTPEPSHCPLRVHHQQA